MAADEYFDAIGQTLSYVLSAEDFIYSQIDDDSGTQFVIRRDGKLLDFYAKPNNRYFTLVYYFLFSQHIADAYEENSDLLNRHMDRFEIDNSRLSDESLYEDIAVHRVQEIENEEAQKIITDIRGLATHTNCRFTDLTKEHPKETETEIWDGIAISGLLYPYESDFSPRDYEQTVQEVISVGNQIDEAMKKLDVMKEIGFDP